MEVVVLVFPFMSLFKIVMFSNLLVTFVVCLTNDAVPLTRILTWK